MGLADCQICNGAISRRDTDLFCTNCGFIVNSPNIDKSDQFFEMAPEKVKKLLDTNRRFTLLDVREPEERAFSKIDGSVHIPLSVLAKNWFALDNRELVVAYDHHGTRALLASKFLSQKGYTAKALAGGIDTWSKTMDKNVKRYNKVMERGKIRISDA